MEFKTKEEFEKYTGSNPRCIDAVYSKPDKHYIYPTCEIFDKELVPESSHTKFIHDTLNNFVLDAVVAQAMGDPVEDLNSNQKLGIFIAAGIPLKYENGKISTLYDVEISMVDGKYKVLYTIPKFNNTYC